MLLRGAGLSNHSRFVVSKSVRVQPTCARTRRVGPGDSLDHSHHRTASGVPAMWTTSFSKCLYLLCDSFRSEEPPFSSKVAGVRPRTRSNTLKALFTFPKRASSSKC